jgi:hypothetical protein
MRGPKQALNFGLSPEEREWVQSLSVQQLLGALQAGFTGERVKAMQADLTLY